MSDPASSAASPARAEAAARWWEGQPEPEPVVTSRVRWSIFDPETEGYLFTGDRVDAERWMQRLWKLRPAAVLQRQEVRSVSQTWFSDPEVVPWEAPCDWIAEGDGTGKQIGDAWCMAHKHREGTPVPAEYVRGGPGA